MKNCFDKAFYARIISKHILCWTLSFTAIQYLYDRFPIIAFYILIDFCLNNKQLYLHTTALHQLNNNNLLSQMMTYSIWFAFWWKLLNSIKLFLCKLRTCTKSSAIMLFDQCKKKNLDIQQESDYVF